LNTTLRKTSPLLIGAILLITGCNVPGTSTTPDNKADAKASIFGTVTKEDGSPAKNATIVLIQKVSGADSDLGIVRTDDNGLYAFNKVPKGNYRVAFVIQTETERKNKTPIAYDKANPNTTQYFGAITTKTFDYEGETAASFQVPAFNVGWTSNLSSEYTTDNKIKFSWSTVAKAKEYNVIVKDSNDNLFFKSTPNQTETSYTWDGKGTEGTNKDKSLTAGSTYYFIVNAVFNETGEGPVISAGNTTNGSFVAK
jgi:flagellar hook assembly protein FlgD